MSDTINADIIAQIQYLSTDSGLQTAQHNTRQSFDRLNDNLVEEILSFLTLNEKVMFESVCKRWQRFVYNRQKEIHLTRWETEENDTLNAILEPIEVVDYNSATAVANGLKQINKCWLKTILQKCPSIEKVVLDCYLDLEDLEIVCRNCPRLNSIDLEMSGLCADDLDHLGHRYGHMFEKVNIYYMIITANYWNKFLIHCNNLKHLTTHNSTQISQLLIDDNYCPKLEVIKDYQLYVNETEGEHQASLDKFEKSCDKLSKTLKDMSLSVYGEMHEKEVESFFNSISKLKQLENFDCYLQNIMKSEDTFDKYVTQLSENVPELKQLRFCFYITNDLKFNHFFTAFKGFHNLVDLDVYIYGFDENTVFEGSVECFKSMNLKNLSISIESIEEEFFKDVDKYLPNLKRLHITTEKEITDKTIAQLSNLKKLQDFFLYKYRKSSLLITDESVCAVINNCPLLKSMGFSARPNITNKTIETLISCANTFPKRNVYFECGASGEEEEEPIPAINMLTFLDRIPDNLTISYFTNNDNDND